MKKFKALALAFGLVALAGCTDSKNAERVLESAGYSDIQITGYSFFACSKDDTQSTGFKAKGPSGKPVSGAVCSGIVIKNSTIRID